MVIKMLENIALDLRDLLVKSGDDFPKEAVKTEKSEDRE